jgi:hypothetical protein
VYGRKKMPRRYKKKTERQTLIFDPSATTDTVKLFDGCGEWVRLVCCLVLTPTAFISIAELPLAREWTRTLFAIHERTLCTVSKNAKRQFVRMFGSGAGGPDARNPATIRERERSLRE